MCKPLIEPMFHKHLKFCSSFETAVPSVFSPSQLISPSIWLLLHLCSPTTFMLMSCYKNFVYSIVNSFHYSPLQLHRWVFEVTSGSQMLGDYLLTWTESCLAPPSSSCQY